MRCEVCNSEEATRVYITRNNKKLKVCEECSFLLEVEKERIKRLERTKVLKKTR